MVWDYLLIFFIVSLLFSATGFYKERYFVSIGYGFSIAGIGAAMFTLSIMKAFDALHLHYVMFGLLVIYGIRLALFVLTREMESQTYQKLIKENEKKKMPELVKVSMWIFVSVLYTAMASPVLFTVSNYNYYPGGWVWVGIIICITGILFETIADIQKSQQKNKNPEKVATKGLYGLVRCPNYFGEMLVWTGVFISSVGALQGFAQWMIAILGYACILFVMVTSTIRLDKRQMKQYGEDEAFQKYASKTPILFPFVPVYHLHKK